MSRWSCTTCSKSFARKGDLTRHESLHTGIKSHICETCGKRFAQFSGLKTHWNVHSKAKPHVCGIGTCTKAFGDPSSRARHRKETHRREAAYECIVTGCGTRIKRRSTFVAHLRKHGLDLDSFDLDAIVLQSNHKGIPALSTHSASPNMEIKNDPDLESRSASVSSLGNTTGHYMDTLGDNGEASHLLNDNGAWSDVLDQTASGLLHNNYPYLPSSFANPFCFDGILPTTVNYPLLDPLPLNLPILDPFLEARSDGSQSSSSSPSSTYSTLYATEFNDDVVSLALASNASQESLLYNTL